MFYDSLSLSLSADALSDGEGTGECVLTEAQVKELEAAFTSASSTAGGSPRGGILLPDPTTLHKLAARLDLTKSQIQVSVISGHSLTGGRIKGSPLYSTNPPLKWGHPL